MKNSTDSFKKKVPVIGIDKSLNQYDNVVLFPHKVAKAKEAFEKFGIPDVDKFKKEHAEEKTK